MPIVTPRLHLFEIEDQDWCPQAVRAGIQSLLQLIWQTHLPPLTEASPAAHAGQIMIENLPKPAKFDFVDYCAGGGGPTPTIEARVNELLRSSGHQPTRFVLTDLYPHVDAWKRLSKKSENITYISTSVDARNSARIADAGRRECRMFNASFHHMDDVAASQILRSAITSSDAIIINEIVARDVSSFIVSSVGGFLSAFILPLFYMWDSPKHMLLTYLVPLIPIALVFDGVVSSFRGRTAAEITHLLESQSDLDLRGWTIKSGSKMVFPPLGNLHWWMAVRD